MMASCSQLIQYYNNFGFWMSTKWRVSVERMNEDQTWNKSIKEDKTAPEQGKPKKVVTGCRWWELKKREVETFKKPKANERNGYNRSRDGIHIIYMEWYNECKLDLIQFPFFLSFAFHLFCCFLLFRLTLHTTRLNSNQINLILDTWFIHSTKSELSKWEWEGKKT